MNRIPFLFSSQMVCFVMYLLSVNAVFAQDTGMASRYFLKADSLLTHRKPDNALEYFNKALVIYTQVVLDYRDCYFRDIIFWSAIEDLQGFLETLKVFFLETIYR